MHCHSGPLFSDQAFHRSGFPDAQGPPDPGRLVGLHALADDRFNSAGRWSDGLDPDLRWLDRDPAATARAFKTPTLRGLARTAPYGHAGRFATLAETLRFYREGMRALDPSTLDPVLTEVGDFDVDDMLAFLAALDGGEATVTSR